MMLSVMAIDTIAQQVRGIETKRVVYNGERYYGGREYSNEYYGWEFANRNSIPVSVSIILKGRGGRGNPDYIVTTKEIVLDSKESYIFKPYTVVSEDGLKVHPNFSSSSINHFYVVYEAYKLE